MRDLPQDEILSRALALDPAARSAFLDEACGEDAALRSELESLLAVAERYPATDDRIGPTDPTSPVPLPDRVGRYPVIGVAGEGGMGLVYRASDPELEREVALKRLPAGIRDDPAALARLRREARVLARLRHPNIATIFSLESEPTGPFLTMELVPGRTLHELLAEGPLPVDRVLRIAIRIAAAMDAAHAEGVVHRDLKPHNIQITEMDEVKVLDFGLAKALDEPAANPAGAPKGSGSGVETTVSEGATGPVTISGRVAGTPGYISPEQLRGQPLGLPADIWAFGCVLFECLTGTSPYHDRATGVHIPAQLRRTLSALELDPDWSSLSEDLPANVVELLKSCLHDEPGDRPDAAAVRRTLESALEQVAAPPLTARLFTRRGVGVVVLAIVTIITAIVIGRQLGSVPEGIPASSVRQLTYHGNIMAFDLSPDGEIVAYLDETSRLVYLDTRTGQGVPAPLTTGAANDTITLVGARACGLRWSPSGRELAVVGVRRATQAITETYIVPRGGHRATPLGVTDFAGTAWSPDGTRLAGTRGIGKETVLCTVDRTGGRYSDVPLERPIKPHRFLDWVADDQLYFTIVSADSVYAVPADGGTPRAVLKECRLRNLPGRDGICYTIDKQLRFAPLEPSGLPSGSYSVLADRVPEFASPFSLARDGRLILYDNPGFDEVWLGQRTATASGDEFRWAQLVRESLSTSAARFSPDGTQIALTGRPAGGTESLLLVHSLADGTRTIAVRDAGIQALDWSPDGTEIVYRQFRGMSRVRLDEGISRQIPGPRDPMYIHWLPDGRIVYMDHDSSLWQAYSQIDPDDGSISRLPIDAERGTLFQFIVAPDARSMAVAGNRGGHYEVKVWLIDLTDSSERLLYDGHAAPFAWSADGRWVYLVTEMEPESHKVRRSRILRVAVDGGAIEAVTDLPEPATGWSDLDLSPDETHMVYTQRRIGKDLWLMDIEPTRD